MRADASELELLVRTYLDPSVSIESVRVGLSGEAATVHALDQLRFPNFGPAQLVARGGSIVYGWRALTFDGTGRVSHADVRVTERSDESWSPPRVVETAPVRGPGASSMALVSLNGSVRTVAVEQDRMGLDVRSVDSDAHFRVPVATRIWDEAGIATLPFGPGSAVVLWHSLDSEGFAVATAVVVTGTGPVGEPVAVLSQLSAPASATVHAGGLWVAGFQRDDAVSRSRIRISRVSLSTLQPTEADRWFAGWGGTWPSLLDLVEWRGSLWAIWIAEDTRFGPHPALFALPLDDVPCGIGDATAFALLSTMMDWSRREWPNQARAAANGDTLWIAVAAGPDAVFDLHRVSSCP
ncbi:MAG: hypothetical protein K8H88_29420 [Sandaracinaceae bacterium]|nr:hypothetical protein [Sandaracinaceae bacterium]